VSETAPEAGWYPEGWVNPAEDPALDWIVPADDDHPDPIPPAERLAEEPEHVEVADNGQQDRLARELTEPPVEGELVTDASGLPRKFAQPGFGGLDLRDYSRLPDGKGWGAPCSAARATIQLSEARVTVDARLAELVGLVMRACEARGYHFRAVDTGAYNCRKIAGTTTWSNHAWGLAVDVNWQSNPYTTRLVTDIPDWMHDLWNRYGFAWGGDYTGGKRDFMHFEFMGTPQQAVLGLGLARAELGSGTPTPTPLPSPPPTPAPAPPQPGVWPLSPGNFPYPHDHCFGLITDPSAKVHGGINETERKYVRWIQQGLIATGCVPGQNDWRSGWADGKWEAETTQAMATYQHRFLPRTTIFGKCYWDDFADLQRR
jgi:hypothetical protein